MNYIATPTDQEIFKKTLNKQYRLLCLADDKDNHIIHCTLTEKIVSPKHLPKSNNCWLMPIGIVVGLSTLLQLLYGYNKKTKYIQKKLAYCFYL